MEVILNQDMEKLGKAGEIVKVKDGFARNYLMPRKLATLVTAGNLKVLEEKKQRTALQLEKNLKSCQELKGRLEELSLTVTALTHDDETLYGSISEQDIAAALKEEGFDIDKNLIGLSEPIKALGIYEALIKLHPEVQAKVKLWIVKK